MKEFKIKYKVANLQDEYTINAANAAIAKRTFKDLATFYKTNTIEKALPGNKVIKRIIQPSGYFYLSSSWHVLDNFCHKQKQYNLSIVNSLKPQILEIVEL